MHQKKFRNVSDVVNWRLCVGCGVCAYVCPDYKIKLVDIENDGIRPFLDSDDCGACRECINVCPGYETIHFYGSNRLNLIEDLKKSWGPVIEVWEGYAADKDLRYHGSSAGLASALALYCLEREGMYGVLHTGSDTKKKWKNKTVFSNDHESILSNTGSRYSPASPCDSLKLIETANSPCVFIGKPCDLSGLRKAQQQNEKLNEKIGVAIGIFCAGTPSTTGIKQLLKSLRLNVEDIEEIRYRGKGWPGNFTVRSKHNGQIERHISYEKSWGFLQKYRPFRCYLCPDGTSEFADISCGDPWYRELNENEKGYSLVLVRTEKGERILHGAIEAGYVKLEQADYRILQKSQKNLLLKREAIWGRLLAMKIFGIPTPRLKGFSLFKNWLDLPIQDKFRSILGTIRRIIQRKYYKSKHR